MGGGEPSPSKEYGGLKWRYSPGYVMLASGVRAMESCKDVGQMFFRVEFSSTYEVMTGVLDRIIGAMYARGILRKEGECCLRLCIEEALVNAIRHGNACDPERKVRVELHEDGERCRIKVFDEGAGFEPEKVALPDCEQMGGRGICIIKHYMDEVHYDLRQKCLEMVFHRQAYCKGEIAHG